MSLSILTTACGNSNRSHSVEQIEQQAFNRADAVARIEARLAHTQAWKERYRPLAERKRSGEDVDDELESLTAARPQFTDLRDDALRVIESNPADEAAFQAIGVVMRSTRPDDEEHWEGSADEALEERMVRVLFEHHLHRSNFLSAAYANFNNHEDSIVFWRKVLDASPWPAVRATAAFRLTKGYSLWLDAPDLSTEKRQELRQEAQRYAAILRDEYADVSPLSKEADKVLAALSYSPGATLSSIEVTTLSGGRDTLTNYRGKVLLLDFWASWCGPCRKDHSKLKALKEEMAGKPFEIIGISADESPEVATDYMAKEHALPWPQWYVGPEGNLLKVWGVSGYPTYLLVGPDGVIQARGVTTYLDAIQAHARKLVAQLDGGR